MTVSLSRRYGFFASHRLHSHLLSEAGNRAVYGKCANPHGHGHNYEVEITVRGPVDPVTGRAVSLASLDRLAEEQILAPFRYRNLNEEVEAFREAVPTTENLAAEIERRLRAAWPLHFPASGAKLERISIWETERNICQIAVL
ncbi:MAG: 6-carboxytetrahydropterin synthase [Acidobacteriota bacterium]|nr:6-carboxytetrahydropterin synthase [Acidobacteriota bacterium]